MIGSTISHYKILEKLGEGGMGIVYKAEDLTLKRTVALKFLSGRIAAGDEERERFKIEAQAAAALNHANIATIYAIEESDDEMFIVMEYVEGRELKKKITLAPLSVDEILTIAIQIAEGLQTAHRKSIVHRDIKSANIMLTEAGQVKIMDFGLAKVRGGSQVTKAGSTVGTAAYMSPEQARGEEVDHRSDIWSFGVVLYEMLSGRMPFANEYEHAIIYSILNETPKPITTLRPDTPEALSTIVHRALTKDIQTRYQSADEILEDLKAIKTSLSPAVGIPVTLSSRIRKPSFWIPALILLLGLSGLFVWWFKHNANVQWAREQALPEVDRLVGESKWTSAYLLARQIEGDVADNPLFAKLRPLYAQRGTIKTDPPGAEIFMAEYGTQPETWISLGLTPTDTIFLPRGIWRLKIGKDGFTEIDGAGTVGLVNQTLFKLDPVGSIPDDMVHVPGGTYGLNIPGLDHLTPLRVGDYLIDKYETTNKSFKEFLDQGGYQKKEYWKHPFINNERTLTWEEAMKEFVDATGMLGPAAWELGTYPDGKADHPVGGISWYEAAAYAEFRVKSLPTVYHWNIAAETRTSAFIIQASNFDNKGTAPVGKYPGVSPFGTRDMGGNVREWCFNESRKQRYIPGGGWNDQPYMFTDFFAQPAFDRSPTNGVRCIKIQEPDSTDAVYASIEMPHREFLKEKPVPDPIFNIYLSLYKYDKTPLNEKIESADTTAEWIMQKVTFDAAYGNDRMIVYLFLPKTLTQPYQVVVYFPGSNAIFDRSSKSLQFGAIDFMVKSGRAVVYPVYKGTYERGSGLNSDYPSETSMYQEHVIAWAKDMGRSIDYLETRNDFNTEKIAYYGLSWGGAMGAIMPAVEPRIKVSVLYVAGLLFQPALPEVEALNFISRINIPIIMLNGKYDHFFPVETSQKPMFALFGTPPQHKKYVLFETGHFVPRNQLIKESLDWLDKYLGPVK